MNIQKVSLLQVAVAKELIEIRKLQNKKIEDKIYKIANAKEKADSNIPKDEIQYILED